MANNARPNKPGKYMQGYYSLQNIEKYIGDPTKIAFRSSYEKRFCFYCDLNSRVLKWGSETVTIPYIGPDGREHRYHTDFYMEVEDENNPEMPKKFLVEVKPLAQTKMPEKPGKLTERKIESYKYALLEYHKNIRKWKAAKEYAESRGMQFIIVTEKHLNMIK